MLNLAWGPGTSATLTLFNSTLSGNTAGNTGGGVFHGAASDGVSTLTLTHSLLSGNTAAIGTEVANFPGTITAGTPVTLNGTASAGPVPLSLTWSGPFGTATGPTPTVPLPLGLHVLTLTVDDGQGGTASDTVIITVRDTTKPALTCPGQQTAVVSYHSLLARSAPTFLSSPNDHYLIRLTVSSWTATRHRN